MIDYVYCCFVDEQLKLFEHATILANNGHNLFDSKKVWQQISQLDMQLQEHRAKVAPLFKQLKEARATLQDLEVQHVEQEGHFTKISLAYERFHNCNPST